MFGIHIGLKYVFLTLWSNGKLEKGKTKLLRERHHQTVGLNLNSIDKFYLLTQYNLKKFEYISNIQYSSLILEAFVNMVPHIATDGYVGNHGMYGNCHCFIHKARIF